MITHLLKPREVGELARPCTADDAIVERAIEEAGYLDIKPKLGDQLFLRLHSNSGCGILLSGGEYTTAGGEKYLFAGLKRALAYYVWARCVKTAAGQMTRFGYVEKRDDYSSHAEHKERESAYLDAFATADGYMIECIRYIEANSDIFPEFKRGAEISKRRVLYKIIGE